MVRCWNCGSFMREDIGALYMKMQAKPAPVIYSHVPGSEDSDEIYDMEEPGDAVLSDDDESPAADDDFELAADVSSRQAPVEEASTYSIAGAAADAKPAESSNGAAAASTTAEDTPVEEPVSDESAPTATGEDAASASSDKGETTADDDGQSVKIEESAEPHSIATGGDALLQIAMEEELETDKRRKQPGRKQEKGRTITGFLVFCANGHRIEVQDRHRGKAGRCPRCKTLFIVPEKDSEPETTAAAEGEGGEGETGDKSLTAGRFTRWMNDVRLHKVNPEKLRLKPGSLEKSFELVDIGFSSDDILIARLPAAKGFLGMASGGGSNDEVRDALKTSLREETPIEDIPAEEKRLVAKDTIQQLAIDQPVVYEHESMFVGIPVFGPGRIAVRLPKEDAKDLPTFLSFDLSSFREFSHNLDQLFGVEEFGLLNEVPLEDEFTDQTCHYSEEKFRSIENPEYYQADDKITLKLVGRKCEGCGLVVSEDSRKKEKIGGANGKSIAKANCPKCKKKFGDISLFDIESAPEAPGDSDAEQPEESADAASTTASK